MGRRQVFVFCVVASAVAVLPAVPGARVSRARGSLELHAALTMKSIGAACPAGLPATTECHARSGEGVVPGLGRVSQEYNFPVDTAPPDCAGSVRVLGYPVRLMVAGKGEIDLAVVKNERCVPAASGIQASQQFTITGGTGIYAGASGSGHIERVASFTAGGAAGTDTWIGTLTANTDFDLAAPTISGATSRVVLAPRRAKGVRVRYAVTASDDVDKSVSVSCRPSSGSRFRLGRTTVTCTAIDTSGNSATARFAITVKARR